MIPYSRDPHQVIPPSSVKIIGLGGAGANMLERIALDGMEGAELLALNTDIRTLGSCLAKEKVQLGINLTKGLGAGGDPELGHQAVLEAEDSIRASVKGRRIVFLCVGLGGGTGSGAAPIVTRIAREEGAFVVVFATMPFAFEGRRRREQAETSLNELAVLSNALVTFDNNRMGELVLAKQGIHEAFVAADQMISESIKAVIRLVIRPGLINVGLDDLMSALRTTRSRCLFGSGMAEGKDRAVKALRNALASPLLDQGSLLKDAQTVLVHLCGGEDLTLFEIELLMQRLQKFVPDNAHVLFGAAIDPAMGETLSLTLISALPEDSLAMAPRESISRPIKEEKEEIEPTPVFTPPPRAAAPAPEPKPEPAPEPKPVTATAKPATPEPPPLPDFSDISDPEPEPEPKPQRKPEPQLPSNKLQKAIAAAAAAEDSLSLFADERPFAEPDFSKPEAPAAAKPAAPPVKDPDLWEDEVESETPAPVVADFVEDEPEETQAVPSFSASEPEPTPIEDEEEDPDMPDLESAGFSPIPRKRPDGVVPWTSSKTPSGANVVISTTGEVSKLSPKVEAPESTSEPEPPKLKLGIKNPGPTSELGLDSAPKGRFEGENPNVFDGEDLDLPPFLRKKK